LIRSKKCH